MRVGSNGIVVFDQNRKGNVVARLLEFQEYMDVSQIICVAETNCAQTVRKLTRGLRVIRPTAYLFKKQTRVYVLQKYSHGAGTLGAGGTV